MKIIVFSLCYNQAEIIPWYLRHYGSFADEISVFDDHSTDGSRELLAAHPKVILRDWPHEPGINEDLFLQHAYEWYPKANPAFDWVFWVDPDEIIYASDIRKMLEDARDFELIPTVGFNMTGDGLPKDDGRSQIWQVSPFGIPAPVYSKPVVFRPSAHVRWNRGKHALENCNPKMAPFSFRLLHYRYMGGPYTAERNAKNYARCGLKSGDKGAAWSCAPGYNGVHSSGWAESVRNSTWNAVTDP